MARITRHTHHPVSPHSLFRLPAPRCGAVPTVGHGRAGHTRPPEGQPDLNRAAGTLFYAVETLGCGAEENPGRLSMALMRSRFIDNDSLRRLWAIAAL